MYKCCFKNYCLITAYCLTLKHKLKSTEHCRNSINNKKGWKHYFTKLTTYSKPWSFWEKHTHIKVNITDIIKIQRSKIYSVIIPYIIKDTNTLACMMCYRNWEESSHLHINVQVTKRNSYRKISLSTIRGKREILWSHIFD